MTRRNKDLDNMVRLICAQRILQRIFVKKNVIKDETKMFKVEAMNTAIREYL